MSETMKVLALVLLVACGGSKPPPTTGSGSAEPKGVVKDTRSEIERRRDAGCESTGTRITECALADLKKAHADGKVTKKDFDAASAPAILKKNTEEWLTTCRKGATSSRQVRVLEVCFKEETECGPFLDCLTHLNDSAKK
jgi:hypothetical protein